MESKRKSKVWQILKGVFALIGVGGIIAIVNFYIEQTERKERKYQAELAQWNSDIDAWKKWSPDEIAAGEFTFNGNGFDLDNTETPHSNYKRPEMDLYFSGGDIGAKTFFRALHGVSWVKKGLVETSTVNYSDLRDAQYTLKRHPESNYYDLFYGHPSNSPPKGYTYFFKTTKGNLSIVKILNYYTEPCRGIIFFAE